MTDKPKRPRDANQLAKFIVDMATGEEAEYNPDTSAQRKGGSKGGKARARNLTKAELKAIARKGGEAKSQKAPPAQETKERS